MLGTVRVLYGNVELLAAEGLFHGVFLPLGGDRRVDHQTLGLGVQTEDTLCCTNHNGGSGTGQPMNVCAACERAVLALNELTVYVRLEHSVLCVVVVGSGSRLSPVLVSAVAVTQLGFSQYQPALRLGEDTCVLLGTLVEALHERSGEAVLYVRRVHYHCAVRSVQLAVNAVHSLLLLLLCSEAGDNGPALRVEPVRGDRICEIQNWLREHEVLTVAELQYRRTGSHRHPRPHPNCIYNWPDKTLYDILARKEYLGHTITGKSYKVSYKSKKTKKNPEEKQYFFPNTHEPLIDEETFDLAQKRIATKHRPTKTEEIDIFSGLLFCGDCGYKMYLQQGAGTLERKHAYTCGKYRNRIRTGELCTTHYIRKSVLKELVLADLQRVLSYVKEHEQEFIETANECSAKAVQKTLTQQRKELDKAQNRINELNILFRKLYEDNALGKLSDEQFAFLTSGYDEEKKTLTRRIAELSQEIDNATERSADVKRFVALVRRYTAIEELTYENVHEFIDRILIHELDKETNTRKIEIFYSFVGRVDTGDKPTESISYFRQIGADVKSYAI